MERLGVVVMLIPLMTSCASQISTRYTESTFDTDTYRITLRQSPSLRATVARDALLVRAAELAKKNGGEAFEVLSSELSPPMLRAGRSRASVTRTFDSASQTWIHENSGPSIDPPREVWLGPTILIRILGTKPEKASPRIFEVEEMLDRLSAKKLNASLQPRGFRTFSCPEQLPD